jgi:hypothetical protein
MLSTSFAPPVPQLIDSKSFVHTCEVPRASWKAFPKVKITPLSGMHNYAVRYIFIRKCHLDYVLSPFTNEIRIAALVF